MENHSYVPVLAFEIVCKHVVDIQSAVGDFFEPRYHSQRGGLAAARGTDKDDELVFFDGEVEVEHRLYAVAVDLVYFVKHHKAVNVFGCYAAVVCLVLLFCFLNRYFFFHFGVTYALAFDINL